MPAHRSSRSLLNTNSSGHRDERTPADAVSRTGPKPLLLVVDTDAWVGTVVDRLAAQLGFDVQTCRTGEEARRALTRRPANVALVDGTNLEGLELLTEIQATAPGCQVVFMGTGSDPADAIEVIQRGAREYLAKPFDPEALRRVLNYLCEEAGRRAHIFALEALVAEQSEFRGMIGRSVVMQDLFSLIQRLAPHATQVLISGETGTGKELAARAFHQAGPRRAQAFMIVNCSAISDATPDPFARADQGTLFLDEIGDLPEILQTRLLHLLESRQPANPSDPGVAVVAVTNRDLTADVASGRFNQALYDRLLAVELRLPALRDRREDIPYLTAVFVRECAQRFMKSFDGLTPIAERLLLNARWDGNVRELRSVIERACMLTSGRVISERELTGTGVVATDTDHRGSETPNPIGGVLSSSPLSRRVPRMARVRHLERDQIVDTLRQVGGNRMAAAKVLGISRRALYRRLERHHISHPAPKARRAEAPTCTTT
jgi:two-component system response regulator AtoC